RDDVRLDLLESCAHGVGDERLIVFVVDVADAVLCESESEYAALERSFLDSLDRVEHGHVDAFHHRGYDAPRRFAVLVGIHANTVLAGLARRLEYAEARGARGVIDDIYALLVLVERELFAFAGIAECFGCDPGVLRD